MNILHHGNGFKELTFGKLKDKTEFGYYVYWRHVSGLVNDERSLSEIG